MRTNGLRALVAVIFLIFARIASAQVPVVEIKAEGDHFKIVGGPDAEQAKFLVFASYFDAMRLYDLNPAALSADFRFLKQHKFDGVRIFPNWWATDNIYSYPTDGLFVKNQGTVNSARLAVLKEVIKRAGEEGLIVDVTFACEVVFEQGQGTWQTYLNSVGQTAAALAAESWDNVIFDVQNERNNGSHVCPRPGGGPHALISDEQVSALRGAIKAADSGLLVSASYIEDGLPPTSLSPPLDFIAFHDGRTGTWYSDTADKVAYVRERFPTLPIDFQESKNWDEDSDDQHHVTAAQLAKTSPEIASIWTFNTATTQDLNDGSYQQKIGANEQQVLEGIRDQSDTWVWPRCQFALTPSSARHSASGGSFTVGVSATDCGWHGFADPDNEWLGVTSVVHNADNSGTVMYNVDANLGQDSRTATLRVASSPLRHSTSSGRPAPGPRSADRERRSSTTSGLSGSRVGEGGRLSGPPIEERPRSRSASARLTRQIEEPLARGTGQGASCHMRLGPVPAARLSLVVALAFSALPESSRDPEKTIPLHGNAPESVLAVEGPRLLRDGVPTFLLGVSVFDGLGDAPPPDVDLDQLRAWGITVVRVWADWHQPVCGEDGRLSVPGRTRLIALARRLEARQIVFELVLLRPGQLPGEPAARFRSAGARERAVSELTRAMRPFRLALFDLFNEHDHPAGPITHREARRLRDIVKAADPGRLVTMSSTETHIVDADGTLSPSGRAALLAEVVESRLDFIAVHLPRTADWARATGARVATLRAALSAADLERPVYLNEERRARAGEPAPQAEDYWLAARGAREAGAIGWVFHTDAGFDLRAGSFLGSLRPAERLALEGLATHVR